MNQSLEKVVVEKDGKKFTQYRHQCFVLIVPEKFSFKDICLATSDGGIYIKAAFDGTTEILQLVSKNTN